MVATERAFVLQCQDHCLPAQLQCAVPVILSADMPASRLEVMVGTEWEVEHWYVLPTCSCSA